MSTRLLTAEDLAHRWQVPTSWVYAKTRSGELPKVPLPGRYYRYRRESIEHWLAESERGSFGPKDINGRAAIATPPARHQGGNP